MSEWFVYILDCDGRLYTGITTDVERRLEEHRAGGRKGARFTRSAREISMRYSARVGSRSRASRIEARIKKLPRSEKLHLLEEAPSGKKLALLFGARD